MGNPLSPIIADLVTEDLLDNALTSLSFTVPHIRKYVDDLFLSLPENEITNTLATFNQQNNNIQFTCEKESNNRLPFLDMTLVRMQDQTIRTEWYIKPIASGRFLNYHSSHPMHQKLNVAFNFAKRVKTLSTNLNASEIRNIVRTHLHTNSYPKSLINRILNRTSKHQNQNINNNTTQQQERPTNTATEVNANDDNPKSFRSLTNIVGLTQQITKILQKECPNIKIATKNTKTVGSLLPPISEKTPILEQSNVVYELKCENNCQARYIGMTSTKLKQRISAHKSNIKQLQTLKNQGLTNTTAEISWLIDKTALLNHIANTGHSFNLDEVQIRARSKKEYLPIIESCFIKNTPNTINKRTDTDNLHAAYAGILNEIKTSKKH